MAEMGRKPGYEYWKSVEGITLLSGWARNGLTDTQIASNMGIGRTTLCAWKNRVPEIRDALRVNKEIADMAVENALYKKACDGDNTAMIFWLKNRRPQYWRDKREISMEGQVPVVISDNIRE